MQHAETPEQSRPPTLRDQEAEFTAEGSPPPGKVAGVRAPETVEKKPLSKRPGSRAGSGSPDAMDKGPARQKKR